MVDTGNRSIDTMMRYISKSSTIASQAFKHDSIAIDDDVKHRIMQACIDANDKYDRLLMMLRDRQKDCKSTLIDVDEKMLVENKPLLDNDKVFRHNYMGKLRKCNFRRSPLKALASIVKGDPRMVGNYDKSPRKRNITDSPIVEMKSRLFDRSPETRFTGPVSLIFGQEYQAEINRTQIVRAKSNPGNMSIDLDKLPPSPTLVRIKSINKMRDDYSRPPRVQSFNKSLKEGDMRSSSKFLLNTNNNLTSSIRDCSPLVSNGGKETRVLKQVFKKFPFLIPVKQPKQAVTSLHISRASTKSPKRNQSSFKLNCFQSANDSQVKLTRVFLLQKSRCSAKNTSTPSEN